LIQSYLDKTPEIHETAFIAEGVHVLGDVVIGAHSSIWFGSVIRGDVHYIRIGERTNVQDLTVIHVNHGGGPISGTLTSQFPGVCFIVGGIDSCSPVVLGDIGCSSDCSNINVASADVPPGNVVVFVATGDCGGGGIYDGWPCGASNDYVLEIGCEQAALGACCLPDGTCIDGTTPEECEAPPGGCGNCNVPHAGPGCTDPVCEAIVCGMDPFCCDVEWDSICAGEAQAQLHPFDGVDGHDRFG